MTDDMTEVENLLDKGDMIETEECSSHADPEVTVLQEGHREDKTIIEIKVTADNRGLEVNPDHLLEDLGLHQGLQAEIKIVFSFRQFSHFAKECHEKATSSTKVKHTDEGIPKHKRCPHIYEGDPEEDDDEEIMAQCLTEVKCNSSI